MNRDNWANRAMHRASWNGQILSGRCEDNDGTWFAISKRGRIAFLVNTSILLDRVDPDEGSELYPFEFLKSNMSPHDFANHVKQREVDRHEELDDESDGWSYSLIVADLISNAMVHIRKPVGSEPTVIIETVPFGVHSVSPYGGLDSNAFPRDTRLRTFFRVMINDLGNDEVPPLREISENTEGGRDAVNLETMDAHPSEELGIQRFGTTSKTTLAVKRNNKVIFNEGHRNYHGDWNWRELNFKIQ
ncbi:uncharacterized protein LOC17879041 [Capsella rubella]|nr:uncharacterized protein LOC17879041 [Capsella rubella]